MGHEKKDKTEGAAKFLGSIGLQLGAVQRASMVGAIGSSGGSRVWGRAKEQLGSWKKCT